MTPNTDVAVGARFKIDYKWLIRWIMADFVGASFCVGGLVGDLVRTHHLYHG